jgi:hypothetical protein
LAYRIAYSLTTFSSAEACAHIMVGAASEPIVHVYGVWVFGKRAWRIKKRTAPSAIRANPMLRMGDYILCAQTAVLCTGGAAFLLNRTVFAQ